MEVSHLRPTEYATRPKEASKTPEITREEITHLFSNWETEYQLSFSRSNLQYPEGTQVYSTVHKLIETPHLLGGFMDTLLHEGLIGGRPVAESFGRHEAFATNDSRDIAKSIYLALRHEGATLTVDPLLPQIEIKTDHNLEETLQDLRPKEPTLFAEKWQTLKIERITGTDSNKSRLCVVLDCQEGIFPPMPPQKNEATQKMAHHFDRFFRAFQVHFANTENTRFQVTLSLPETETEETITQKFGDITSPIIRDQRTATFYNHHLQLDDLQKQTETVVVAGHGLLGDSNKTGGMAHRAHLVNSDKSFVFIAPSLMGAESTSSRLKTPITPRHSAYQQLILSAALKLDYYPTVHYFGHSMAGEAARLQAAWDQALFEHTAEQMPTLEKKRQQQIEEVQARTIESASSLQQQRNQLVAKKDRLLSDIIQIQLQNPDYTGASPAMKQLLLEADRQIDSKNISKLRQQMGPVIAEIDRLQSEINQLFQASDHKVATLTNLDLSPDAVLSKHIYACDTPAIAHPDVVRPVSGTVSRTLHGSARLMGTIIASTPEEIRGRKPRQAVARAARAIVDTVSAAQAAISGSGGSQSAEEHGGNLLNQSVPSGRQQDGLASYGGMTEEEQALFSRNPFAITSLSVRDQFLTYEAMVKEITTQRGHSLVVHYDLAHPELVTNKPKSTDMIDHFVMNSPAYNAQRHWLETIATLSRREARAVVDSLYQATSTGTEGFRYLIRRDPEGINFAPLFRTPGENQITQIISTRNNYPAVVSRSNLNHLLEAAIPDPSKRQKILAAVSLFNDRFVFPWGETAYPPTPASSN